MDQTTTTFHIGQLAAELGLNPKTIRYYEDIGLLPPPPRTRTGYRLYSSTEREQLRFILKARAIGLTLEEIKAILQLRGDGVQPCQHVLGLLDQKLAGVEQQLRALAEFRQELIALRDEASQSATSDAHFCRIIEQHTPAHPHESPLIVPKTRRSSRRR
jgi:MerR family Zn(II)-responsive transcriptional regulator of zntA